MPAAPTQPNWIVCQIGARENYTIPRALHRAGRLEMLLTDIWARPGTLAGASVARNSMFNRWHSELADARVVAPNPSSFLFEVLSRSRPSAPPSSTIMRRNRRFQQACLRHLKALVSANPGTPKTVFAFSYAAGGIFEFAREHGWTTVLGQIDPGPYEETLVAREHQKYPQAGSTWRPAPQGYWDLWREETQLADRILVNSPWARDGLLAEGVDPSKIRIVPLFCEAVSSSSSSPRNADLQSAPLAEIGGLKSAPQNLKVIFIGRVSLRKGIARLIDAMRLLRDQPVELHIYGTLSVTPVLWRDLPNVHWHGSVRHAGIGRIYSEADVFILPTISDGFARTQLEALACGTPVIASRNCGNVVIDGVNGFLLEQNTPEEIADLFTALAADRSRLALCDTRRLPERMPQSLEQLAAEILKAAPPCTRQSAAANPAPLTCQDVAGTIRRKSLKSIIRVISISLIFTLATTLSITGWIWYGDWPRVGPSRPVENPALILVLGGDHDTRVRETLRFAGDFPETPILVTGDGGWIVNRLIEDGIDSSRIHIEPKAENTYANATLSSPWVRNTTGNIVLVTSDFHAPRAMAVFRKVFPERHFSITYEASDPRHADWTKNFRRERAAALYYLVRYRVNCFRDCMDFSPIPHQ